MKIRSVTCFYNPASGKAAKDLERAGALANEVAKRIQNRGFEVQSTRLATTPFAGYLDVKHPEKAVQGAQKLESEANQAGFAHLALGPALPGSPQSYAVIPAILAATKNVFLGGVMASKREGVALAAVKACAEVIHQSASITPDGFANLRFAGLANVKPFAPFFPAAYSKGGKVGFALAIECADLALLAFTRPLTLAAARASLLKTLQDYARVLTGIAEETARQFDAVFLWHRLFPGPLPASLVLAGQRYRTPGTSQVGPIRLAGGGGLRGRPAGPGRLETHRIQRPDAAGAGRFDAGAAFGRRQPDPQGPALVFRRVRHGAGYRSTAGRYFRPSTIRNPAGPVGAGGAAGQTTHGSPDAHSWEISRGPDQFQFQLFCQRESHGNPGRAPARRAGGR